MKKLYLTLSLIITACLFACGLYILTSSVNIGQSKGQRVIAANGGSMDTQQYYGVINNTTENYRIGGIIISVTGGVGVLLTGCGIYENIGRVNRK